MTITVLGAGYVGLTTAALFAQAGYKVYVVEPNQERLSVIKLGRSFFYEEGLDNVIERGINSGSLIPTDSYEDSVPESDIVFSCVGTPDNPDGSSNLTYVFDAARSSAKLMRPDTVFAQKSTVPVGTGAQIESLFAELNADVRYVSNPEFLREGTALRDTLLFDRIVVGGTDQAAIETVLELYRTLESNRDDILRAAGIEGNDTQGEYIAMNIASAELTKVTANAFLALKISFANSIAKLADESGADVVEVMDAVGADKRIGRAFLNAGRGYGGGCFPKDVSGLVSSGQSFGVDLELVRATQLVNESMPDYVVSKLKQSFTDPIKEHRIGVLGLAFKAGTSDARKSPGVSIANKFAEDGAQVFAYDPKANNEASHDLVSKVHLTNLLNEVLEQVDTVVVTTDWPEFCALSPTNFTEHHETMTVLDAVNCLDKKLFQDSSVIYLGIGR